MPAIYHEGSWLGNATDPEVLVKDTVGFTGKNRLKNTATSQTINGVTFTVNADKSVTVNGTATANTVFPLNLAIKSKLEENGKYILSGCPSGGATNKYKLDFRTVTASSSTDAIYNDIGEGATFTLTNAQYSSYELGVTIRIENGATVNNLIFYPMLRKADITDPTYEPYHESVEVMYEEEIHGVNLLKNEATTQTINGVTFTVNSDGTITANGTATGGYAQLQIRNRNSNPYNLPIGSYIGNGCPVNGSASTYQMRYIETIDGQAVEHRDYGEGVKFDVTKVNNMGATIYISNGATVNNLVFKPMIRKADIEDGTYRPYNEQAIQNQLNAQGVLGAKNLIPYPYRDGTRTMNGVTFTENDDGSITLNGTCNSTSYSSYGIFGNNTDKSNQFISGYGGKALIASLKSSSSVSDKVYLQCYKQKADGTTVECYAGDNIEYRLTTTEPQGGGGIYVVITPAANGYTFNNVTLYPMIRLASDPDDTYQPYAMTNRELTEEVSNIKSVNAVGTITANSNLNDYYKTGDYYSNTGSNTSTLVNKPSDLTGAFRLSVICAGYPIGEGGNASNVPITQKIELVNGATPAIYMRHKTAGSNTYGSWYKFTGTVVS